MRILTLSAKEFNGFRPRKPSIAIRVFDSKDDIEPFDNSSRFPFLEVLTLDFIDFSSTKKDNQKYFNKEDLIAIKKLIEQNPTAEELVIHCNLGIVRSTGIADGLSRVFGWEVSNGHWNDRTTYPERNISETIKYHYQEIVI